MNGAEKKSPRGWARGEEFSLFGKRLRIPTQVAPKFIPWLFRSVSDGIVSNALLHCETVVCHVTRNKIRCTASIIEEVADVIAVFQIILDSVYSLRCKLST